MSNTPKRQVVVEMTVRYVTDVMADADVDFIHFAKNDGCWCTSNDIDMLKRMSDAGHCVCFQSEIRYLREASQEDKDTLGYTALVDKSPQGAWI